MAWFKLVSVTLFLFVQSLSAAEKSPLAQAPGNVQYEITRFIAAAGEKLRPLGYEIPEISFDGCFDCTIAWGVRNLHADGTVEDEAAVFKNENGKLSIGSSFTGSGLARTIFPPISTDPTVIHTCIYDIHICLEPGNAESCKPIGQMYYEFDVKTGAASTSLPLKKGLSLPAGSDKFQPKVCTDQIS